MKSFLWKLLVLLVLLLSGYILIAFYPYIFSRNVKGTIVTVERPVTPTALVGVGEGAQNAATTLFSYAVAIRETSGEIVTASTEDRQWAVAQIGKCVEAKYYPYPPWNFDKSGTYYNARLLKLYDCSSFEPQQPAATTQQESALQQVQPVPTESIHNNLEAPQDNPQGLESPNP